MNERKLIYRDVNKSCKFELLLDEAVWPLGWHGQHGRCVGVDK